jgi:hypothetical protein
MAGLRNGAGILFGSGKIFRCLTGIWGSADGLLWRAVFFLGLLF